MARRVPVTRCRTVSGDDAEAFAAVDAGADALPPGAVVEIPADRPRQAALDALLRRPAELALDLARVDGVAEVVAGAVGDEGDQVRAGCRCARSGASSSSEAQMASTTSRLVRSLRPPIL